MKSSDDLRELATRIREQTIGIDGWIIVDGGGGLFCVPVTATTEEWEKRHHLNEPVDITPEPADLRVTNGSKEDGPTD